MTRLDQNRALSQIALKTGARRDAIKGVINWGNHSPTQYPDTFHATINGRNLRDEVNDDAYLDGAFIRTVANRGEEII